jgi:hypothetical protein
MQGEEAHFWESELGQYIAAEADDSIAIEDVRQALSVLPGSLAAEVSRERDDLCGSQTVRGGPAKGLSVINPEEP